ncbi:type II secretion system F family protein, partial [Campylobacter peloridis]
QAFLKIEIFENFVIRMLNLSFKSSNLDESSYELALFFENKKEEYMQRLFVLLEPLMVFFMAGLILILALGVFLPMWQISHGF